MLPPGYGTNLHRAETLAEVIDQVVPFARAVRERLGWARLGVDLRLGLTALGGDDDLNDFTPLRRALDGAGLSAHTLNGFPLRAFQADHVKEQAYLPDWSEPQRRTATTDLLIAALELSDEPVVTISTLAGSFRPLGAARNDVRAFAAALGTWAALAHEVERNQGRTVVLCLEPEPWCLLENSHDVAAFWRGPLAEHGYAAAAQALSGDGGAARTALERHLALCFDTCHFALAFEDPAAAVARITGAGCRIAKCQLSAAPAVRHPHRDAAGVAALRALAEPRFLHQVAAIDASGSQARALDLDGLDGVLARLPEAEEVRAHFHIPLTRPATADGLSSTIADGLAGLKACVAAGCSHVAVETYTWSLLGGPDAMLAGTADEVALLGRTLAT